MHKSTLLIGALALGSACMGMPAQTRAQDVAQTPAPLFPVADHGDFPQPGATFEEVRRLILDRYYSDSIDEPSLYHAAILGMLRHVSPPDSPDLAKLWSAEQYAAITNALQGISATIGIRSRFDQGDGSLTVTEVLPGSASEGSLRVRDRILRIDGAPLKDKTLDEINALLSGEDGSTVELTVVRDIEVLRFRVQREPFALQNLVSAMLPNATAYVRLRRVTQHASEELRAALQTHLAQGARRAIIDLRDNSGGVFTEGMRLAELFLPAKSIIVRTARRAEQVKT